MCVCVCVCVCVCALVKSQIRTNRGLNSEISPSIHINMKFVSSLNPNMTDVYYQA